MLNISNKNSIPASNLEKHSAVQQLNNPKHYKILNKTIYKNRTQFIDIAQHPEKGILVVGEVVSENQGWTEGALESVKAVLTKKWVHDIC